MFKNGRTNVHDEERSGRPTIVTDELVAKINEMIHENRRFTITDFSLENGDCVENWFKIVVFKCI